MTDFRRCFSFALFVCILSLAGFAAFAKRSAKTVPASLAKATTVLRGSASWYGRELQGHHTSNGERYNRFQYTCAHRTLPFGTRLRVTNPTTGKSVVVRVSDRGPFRRQRILDLSEVAAKPLGIVCCGAASVIAEIVPSTTALGPTKTPDNLAALQAADPTPQAPSTTYSLPDEKPAPVAVDKTAEPASAQTAEAVPAAFLVQAGTFADPGNAQALQAKIEALDERLAVRLMPETINGRLLNRVLVGSFAERSDAEALRRRLLVWGIGGLVKAMPM